MPYWAPTFYRCQASHDIVQSPIINDPIHPMTERSAEKAFTSSVWIIPVDDWIPTKTTCCKNKATTITHPYPPSRWTSPEVISLLADGRLILWCRLVSCLYGVCEFGTCFEYISTVRSRGYKWVLIYLTYYVICFV